MTKPSWQDLGTHDESIVPELWDGVIGAWAPCLGPTGSRLHDMSRRANWGTLTNMDNATDWVVDGGQYALDFDGSNDYAATSLSVPTSRMTFAVWAKPRATGLYIRPCGDADSSAGTRGTSLIFLGAQQLYWVLRGGTASDLNVTGLPIATNEWTHVVCSLGDAPRMIVNGKLVATGSGTSFSVWAGSWLFGTDDISRFGFQGLIADGFVWSRALSVNEANQLYQLGPGGMYQRRRRTRKVSVQVGNAIWLKTGGVWKETTPWIKVGGIWKQASPNIKISGVWE